MAYGQNFGRLDSGRLPEPAVPPEFHDRMRPRGRDSAPDGAQQPRTGDWRGQHDYQGSGWHQGAVYPDSGRQGFGQYPPQPGQWQGHGQPLVQPQPPFKPPQPPRRRQSWPAQHKALTGLFVFVGLITIIVAANAGGSSSSSGGTAATGTQPGTSAPAAAPKATQTVTTAQTITYEVTGAAADVTYGAAGSSLSGTVPMKVTAKLGDPIYYSLTAQLQGGGSVTVKILIDGTVISQGSATGGYNIASAEISQDPLSGQWVDTNNG